VRAPRSMLRSGCAPRRCARRSDANRCLSRVEVVIAPENTACPCCKDPMHVIGEESSERLDFIPAQYRVLVTPRPNYACRACSNRIVQAPAPERLIKGGLPTEAMVAQVGEQIRLALAALSPDADAQEPRDHDRARDARLLGRLCGGRARPAGGAPARAPARLGQTCGGRDASAGTRSRTRTHQDWILLVDGARRPAVEQSRSAQHAVKLLADYRGIVQCESRSGADRGGSALALLRSTQKRIRGAQSR
jgi:transposase